MRGPPQACGGFTLVEILVALLLLAVGIAGSMATLLLALRIQGRAEVLELALQRSAEVADSVVRGGRGGSGEEEVGGQTLRWSIPEGGWGVIELLPVGGEGTPLFSLELRG